MEHSFFEFIFQTMQVIRVRSIINNTDQIYTLNRPFMFFDIYFLWSDSSISVLPGVSNERRRRDCLSRPPVGRLPRRVWDALRQLLAG